MTNTCSFCDNEATKLCDYVIGFFHNGRDYIESDKNHHESIKMNDKWYIAVTSTIDKTHTCDKRLCDDCSKVQGMIFWPMSFGGAESTDWCPDHIYERPKPITDLRAKHIRLGKPKIVKGKFIIKPEPLLSS